MANVDKKIADPQGFCRDLDAKMILFSMILSTVIMAGLAGFNTLQLAKIKSILAFNSTLPFTQYTISNIVRLNDGAILGLSIFMVFWAIALFSYYVYYKRNRIKAIKFVVIMLMVLFIALLAPLQSALISSSIYRLYVVLPDKVSSLVVKGNTTAARHLIHVVESNAVASITLAQLFGVVITLLSAVVAIFLLRDIIYMRR